MNTETTQQLKGHVANQIGAGVYPIGDQALKALEAKDTIRHWIVKEVVMRERNIVTVRLTSDPMMREAAIEMSMRQWEQIGSPVPEDKLSLSLQITKIS